MMLAKFILFLPLIAAVIVGLNTSRMHYRVAQIITTGATVIAAILSVITFKNVAINGDVYNIIIADWINSGSFVASWSLQIDALTATMLVVVTGVSSLVHLYSIGYMDEDEHKQRFMCYLSLFTFFMLVLVTGNNFIQMFVGWEGVGLCSYLLIGFWFKKPSANAASIKAFVVNRVGDFGFILGIAAVFVLFGSVEYSSVFPAAASKADVYWNLFGFEVHALTLTCILLFIGACGKSAQIGLHTWLPDAMEGPTPVSALIHAATMVTAGVFMLARISPMLEFAPTAREVVVVVGAITALFAATIAVTQNDIKKVIAYSTCSQLGYMVFVCGLSAYSAGIFHLATHAFFKALLFLSAGSVIHAMHHEQDMREYGGLWKKIPITYAMFWIGSLAIIGAPFFAGYYSKEAILELAGVSGKPMANFAFWMGFATAVLTSFYSFRLLFMTFHGKPRGDKETHSHAHESPIIMLIPLFILAVGAVFSGYYGAEILGVLNGTEQFWGTSIVILPENNELTHLHHTLEHTHNLRITMLHQILLISAIMVALSFYIYAKKYKTLPKKLAKTFKPLYLASHNKWYVDEIYNAIFVRPTFALSRYFWKTVDTKVVDGMPNGFAKLSGVVGRNLQRFQTGFVFQYSFVMVLAVLALVGYFVIYLGVK
jgi:NADH-quinone oxidoreductase subunit L